MVTDALISFYGLGNGTLEWTPPTEQQGHLISSVLFGIWISTKGDLKAPQKPCYKSNSQALYKRAHHQWIRFRHPMRPQAFLQDQRWRRKNISHTARLLSHQNNDLVPLQDAGEPNVKGDVIFETKRCLHFPADQLRGS